MKEKKRFWLYDLYALICDNRRFKHRLIADYYLSSNNALVVHYSGGPHICYDIETYDDKVKAIADINSTVRNIMALIF